VYCTPCNIYMGREKREKTILLFTDSRDVIVQEVTLLATIHLALLILFILLFFFREDRGLWKAI
jgi:hypothetical protein